MSLAGLKESGVKKKPCPHEEPEPNAPHAMTVSARRSSIMSRCKAPARSRDIAHHLSNERRMRNHGLTARKIGFFIPRYVAEITFELDPNSGKRIYSLAA